MSYLDSLQIYMIFNEKTFKFIKFHKPMSKFLFFSFVSILIILTSYDFSRPKKSIGHLEVDEWGVEDALIKLGDSAYNHHIVDLDNKKVEMGKDLVFKGYTRYNGKKSKRISPYFVCTDCHNTKREFGSENSSGKFKLKSDDPQKRLIYAIKNDLPFLPGSTLWGIYNRTSFYNGDYRKKYDGLVDKAKDDLPEAIQVCAQYCSSGRVLKDWELDAIMHYFKSEELKIKDLGLTPNFKKNLIKYQSLDDDEKKDLISLIKNKYFQYYPANFLHTMPKDKRGYGESGNSENGEELFKRSCLHCHGEKRVTYLSLDTSKLTGDFFLKYIKGYRDQSLYQIIRWGTYAKRGRQQYMPQYSKEKMSDDQIEDLIAYMKKLSKK